MPLNFAPYEISGLAITEKTHASGQSERNNHANLICNMKQLYTHYHLINFQQKHWYLFLLWLYAKPKNLLLQPVLLRINFTIFKNTQKKFSKNLRLVNPFEFNLTSFIWPFKGATLNHLQACLTYYSTDSQVVAYTLIRLKDEPQNSDNWNDCLDKFNI